MRGLKGKIIAITGGASGIGNATVKRLAEEGARLAILDLNGDGAKAEAEAIRASGGDAIGIGCDVSKQDQVIAAFEIIDTTYGRLDVLVACAGINMPDDDGKIDEFSLETWQKMMDINFTGMMMCCHNAVPLIRKTGKGGAIVCVGSPTGVYGLAPHHTAYSSSKAGIAGMSRAMAVGYGKENIRVNTVMPGVVFSGIASPEVLRPFLNMVPMRRAAQADEVAASIAFLASDDASFTTGSFLYCDGGVSAGSPILEMDT